MKETNAQRKDLKILKKLIESQWSDEISAQAGTNLTKINGIKVRLVALSLEENEEEADQFFYLPK